MTDEQLDQWAEEILDVFLANDNHAKEKWKKFILAQSHYLTGAGKRTCSQNYLSYERLMIMHISDKYLGEK
jgi:hypothetical protein